MGFILYLEQFLQIGCEVTPSFIYAGRNDW